MTSTDRINVSSCQRIHRSVTSDLDRVEEVPNHEARIIRQDSKANNKQMNSGDQVLYKVIQFVNSLVSSS